MCEYNYFLHVEQQGQKDNLCNCDKSEDIVFIIGSPAFAEGIL